MNTNHYFKNDLPTNNQKEQPNFPPPIPHQNLAYHRPMFVNHQLPEGSQLAENSQLIRDQPQFQIDKLGTPTHSIYVSQSSLSGNPFSLVRLETPVHPPKLNLIEKFLVKPRPQRKRRRKNLRLNLSGRLAKSSNNNGKNFCAIKSNLNKKTQTFLRFKTPVIAANGPPSAGNGFMSVKNLGEKNFFKFGAEISQTSIGGCNFGKRNEDKNKNPVYFRVSSMTKIDESLGIKKEHEDEYVLRNIDSVQRPEPVIEPKKMEFQRSLLQSSGLSIPKTDNLGNFDFQSNFRLRTPVLPTIPNQTRNLEKLHTQNNFFSAPIIPKEAKIEPKPFKKLVQNRLKPESKNHIKIMFSNFDYPFSQDQTKMSKLKKIALEMETLSKSNNSDRHVEQKVFTKFLCHLQISQRDMETLNPFQKKRLLMNIFKKTFDLKEIMFNWKSHSESMPARSSLLGKRAFNDAIPKLDDNIFVEENEVNDLRDKVTCDDIEPVEDCPDMASLVRRVITFLDHFEQFKARVKTNQFLRDSYNYSIFKNGPRLRISQELLSMNFEQLLSYRLNFSLLQEFFLFKNISYTKNQKLRDIILSCGKFPKKIRLKKSDIQNLRFIKRRKEHEFSKYIFRLALKTFRVTSLENAGKRLNFGQKNEYIKNNFFKLSDLRTEFEPESEIEKLRIEDFLSRFFPKSKKISVGKNSKYPKNNCPNYQIGFFKTFTPFHEFMESMSLVKESVSKICGFQDNMKIKGDLKLPSRERELLKNICMHSGRLPWSLQESLIGIHYLEAIRPAISFSN